MESMLFRTADELTSLYAAGDVSPVEVVREVFRHLHRVDGVLHAFVEVLEESALQNAREAEDAYKRGEQVGRPLLGVPVTIKDQIPIAGVRMTHGSPIWSEAPASEADAPSVERLKAAGAVIIGTTNVPEFGWKGDSGNPLQGPTFNPFNPTRTSGGSSGGCAVAVATGLGVASQGGDGAGSIRIPAAFCGVFGLKPSHGLIPWYPASSLELLVCEGPITRSVADAALMLEVTAGPDERDRLSQNRGQTGFVEAIGRDIAGLRAGWSANFGYARVDDHVLKALQRSLSTLESLGVEVTEIDVAWDDPLPLIEIYFATACAAAELTGWGRPEVPDRDTLGLLGPGLRQLVEKGMTYSGAELAAASQLRLELYERIRSTMSGVDFLVTPTLPVTAFPAGQDHPDSVAGHPATPYSWLPFTFPFNLTGHPAASVPAGLADDGLPVALQVVGQWRDDGTVLKVASALERANPWAKALEAATERLIGAPGA